jgi:L-malate glycosyltransferase
MPAQVLYIIDSLCDWAGAERALLRMTRALPADRYRCAIATFRTHPSVGDLSQFPCPVHVLPMRRVYGRDALRAGLRLRSLIRSQKVDIVHTFFETADLWGGIVARLSGCRVLISSRRDMGILRSPKHSIAYRMLGGLFDQVQAVCGQVRQFCISADGFPAHKVVTIYNGIDMPGARSQAATSRWRNTPELAGASHVIVAVGHVRRVKGTDVLVRAAARVCAEFPRAVFAIAGGLYDSAYYGELQSAVRSLGLSRNVHFLDRCGDVTSLLQASDVYCMLSRSEGLSNALLEAMSCGLPCVVTPVGGNPELIDNARNGFLVPPEDAEAAAESILRLLRNQDLAVRLGAAARQTVESRFTTEAMVRSLVAEYDRLLDRRGPVATAPAPVETHTGEVCRS